VALSFVKEGASVCIVYLDEETDAKETKEILKEAEGDYLFLSVDVREAEACNHVVEETIRQFGKLDIVVNNAGVQYPQESLSDISDQQFKNTFETNTFSHFYLTRAALPHPSSGA